MVCQFLSYNKVNELYIYIYPPISSLLSLPPTLSIPPLQVITKHGADLPVLCSSFPPAIHFTFGSVCMSMLLSHFVPAPPFPCVLKSVLYVCVFSFFFLLLHCTACRILVPSPRIEPAPLAVKARSPNHWTTREDPFDSFLFFFF